MDNRGRRTLGDGGAAWPEKTAAARAPPGSAVEISLNAMLLRPEPTRPAFADLSARQQRHPLVLTYCVIAQQGEDCCVALSLASRYLCS